MALYSIGYKQGERQKYFRFRDQFFNYSFLLIKTFAQFSTVPSRYCVFRWSCRYFYTGYASFLRGASCCLAFLFMTRLWHVVHSQGSACEEKLKTIKQIQASNQTDRGAPSHGPWNQTIKQTLADNQAEPGEQLNMPP